MTPRKRRPKVTAVRGTVAISLLCVASAALAACGGNSSSGSGSTSGTAASKHYKITAIAVQLPPNGFTGGLLCGMKQGAKQLGVDLAIQGPSKFDAAAQTSVINAVAASKPDAIVIHPADPKAVVAPLRLAATAGTKVVTVDTPLTGGDFVTGALASDNEGGGVAAGKAMVAAVGGKGKVVTVSLIAGLPGLSSGPGRQHGFETVMKATPGIDFLGVQYTNNDVTKAAQVVSALLARYPDLAGIYLPAPVDSAGVFNALKAAGKLGTVKVVAFDPREDLVKEMKAGNISALIAQDIRKEGELGVQYAVDALKGQTVPKATTVLPVHTITSDQVDDPAEQKYFYVGC
jgi:ribose transport system substrate-binding protein